MIDIGKLQTDVAWLKKWLERLGLVAAIVLGWILLYLYMPMRDLTTSVAVQTASISDLAANVKDIKESVRAIDSRMDDAADRRAATAQKKHR